MRHPPPPLARKRFGQHFLHDPRVIARIVAAIRPSPGERIVEIGPGRGALTLPLIEALGEIDAVEIDRDVIRDLHDLCRGRGVLRLHEADALRFPFHSLLQGAQSLRVVGNLPYNISTPLLFHLLDEADCIRDMVFMLQKEVVERLAAHPGGGDYGRLSVMVQYRCTVEKLFDVGRGAFQPPPKVESSMVRLMPDRSHTAGAAADFQRFADLVRLAFCARRKTLRNALKAHIPPQAFEAAGVDPGLRPEALSVCEFVRLANAASALCCNGVTARS